MGKIKGCVNGNCVACKKKTVFKEPDAYCPKCGNKLAYVCSRCHTPLDDEVEKYCVRCLADKMDQKEHARNLAGAIVGGAATLGIAAVTKGKDIVKFAATNGKKVAEIAVDVARLVK